jgi:DNA repair photolyase
MNEFKSPYKQLNRKVNTWCRYTKRLDTYGCGCQHDCKYCYAKSLLNFRGFWNEPKCADLYRIKCAIKRLSTRDTVRIGGMTDCFQPLEMTEKLTYRTILILNQFRISYLIVTKSDLVANDQYINIYDKKLSHFQITITSTNKNNYEKAPAPSKRIKAIEKLYLLGFDVSLRLSPFLFQNIDLDIVNNIQCDKILIEFLKVNPAIEKTFDIDYNEYTLKFGGFRHLPLTRKIELVNKITGFKEVTVGEYVYDHYLYFRDNVNFNKSDCCNLNERKFENHLQLTLL